jgi:CBS domain-containing protein
MSTPISIVLGRKASGVFCVNVTDTVAEAVRVMNTHRVGSVLVTSGGRLVGIFTERDVLTRVVAPGRAPANTRIDTVMTPEPITVSPQTSVDEVMALITERRCRHLPVLDEEAGYALVGLISIGDVMRWLLEENQAEANQLKQYIAGGF